MRRYIIVSLVFDTRNHAEQAADALEAAGYDEVRISHTRFDMYSGAAFAEAFGYIDVDDRDLEGSPETEREILYRVEHPTGWLGDLDRIIDRFNGCIEEWREVGPEHRPFD